MITLKGSFKGETGSGFHLTQIEFHTQSGITGRKLIFQGSSQRMNLERRIKGWYSRIYNRGRGKNCILRTNLQSAHAEEKK